MMTESMARPAMPGFVESDRPWDGQSGMARSMNAEPPKLDCAAMARMPLPSLLYYVLVGDGRFNPFA